MATRRNKLASKKTRTARKSGKKSRKPQRSWTTAIEAAQMELERSGSVTKAHTALRSQALLNARKIFGSVGKTGGSI
jgi:hypothetical protein